MSKEQEYRLWDTQWLKIVNHADCYKDFTKEEAVAHAVMLTEKALARNYGDGTWPTKREPIKDAPL